jgi:hypothetical protein
LFNRSYRRDEDIGIVFVRFTVRRFIVRVFGGTVVRCANPFRPISSGKYPVVNGIRRAHGIKWCRQMKRAMLPSDLSSGLGGVGIVGRVGNVRAIVDRCNNVKFDDSGRTTFLSRFTLMGTNFTGSQRLWRLCVIVVLVVVTAPQIKISDPA